MCFSVNEKENFKMVLVILFLPHICFFFFFLNLLFSCTLPLLSWLWATYPLSIFQSFSVLLEITTASHPFLLATITYPSSNSLLLNCVLSAMKGGSLPVAAVSARLRVIGRNWVRWLQWHRLAWLCWLKIAWRHGSGSQFC